MIYSTALLERAWLECETSNRRERAIIQIQALVDQHGNRLTITQSTFKGERYYVFGGRLDDCRRFFNFY